MAINYPTSLDSFTNPTATDLLTSPSHAQQHSDINDAMEAVQTKLAIGNTVIGTYTAYTPTYIGFTLGNGTVTSAFCRVNDFVHYYAEVTLGSTSSVTGPVFVSVPVNVNAEMLASGSDASAYIYGTASYTDQGTLVNYGWITSNSATTMRLMVQTTTATYAQRISMNTAVPFTWVATDSFRFNAYYRAA